MMYTQEDMVALLDELIRVYDPSNEASETLSMDECRERVDILGLARAFLVEAFDKEIQPQHEHLKHYYKPNRKVFEGIVKDWINGEIYLTTEDEKSQTGYRHHLVNLIGSKVRITIEEVGK